MGQTRYKVNTFQAGIFAAPVCAAVSAGDLNNAAVIYNGNPSDVYCNQEGLKTLFVKGFPQGQYNPVTNKLVTRDTLKVYICKSISPYNVIDSSTGILDSVNLNALFRFYTLNDGSYYIKIKHRNSIETWSNTSVDFSAVANINHDFIVDDQYAYGDNETQVDSSPIRFGLFGGDVDQDGNVDATDIIKTYNDVANIATGYIATDLTGDRFTDISDLIIVYNNANAVVSVEKP